MKTLQLNILFCRTYQSMASQPSDILSTFESEQSEAPNSSVNIQSSASFSRNGKKKGQNRTSPIWNHTTVGRHDTVFNARGKSVWRCKYCQKEYSEAGGTTIIIAHLKEHKVNIISTAVVRQATIQSNIANAFQRAEQSTTYKRRRLAPLEEQALDPAVLEYLYTQWITTCGVSFRMASQATFRA
jgi:hypothetical protein